MDVDIGNFFKERMYSVLPDDKPNPEEYPLYAKATKIEIQLNEGERLFIPVGWWHFVFSEEVGDIGINFALNFWYSAPSDYVEGRSGKDRPFKESSVLQGVDPLKLLKDEGSLRVFKSTSRKFISDTVTQRYPNRLEVLTLSTDEFLSKRDPLTYVLQHSTTTIDHLAPKHTTKLQQVSLWANFGNIYSHMHYDNYDNFLYQIKGTRRVVLYAPEDRDYLYTLNPYSLDKVLSKLSCAPAKTKKVLIGTYSEDGNVSSRYAASIADTVVRSRESNLTIDNSVLTSDCGENMSRNELITSALESGCTHLVLINRNVSWRGADFIECMKVDADILGIPYRNGERYVYDRGSIESNDSDGKTEVEMVGFGFVIINRCVLEKLILNVNETDGLFGTKVKDVFQNYNDTDMCKIIKSHGYKVHLSTKYAADRVQQYNLTGTSLSAQ